MSTTALSPPTLRAPRQASRPRWPALVLVALGVALYFGASYAAQLPNVPMLLVFLGFMWAPLVCMVLLGLWWLALGPAPLRTRIVSSLLVVLVAAGAVALADGSTQPTRFFMTLQGVPAAVGVLAVALVVLGVVPWALRVSLAVLLGLAALLPWDLIRMEGVTGNFGFDATWRWTPSAEERAARYDLQEGTSATVVEGAVEASEGDWPAFRGPRRDGVAQAVYGGLSLTSLKEKWRRPVRPAWSSVCVVGDSLFTQEQRGEDEVVLCCDADTGKTVWSHGEKARHNDFASGAGPRATPTFHAGKVYAQGAGGGLVCLKADTGDLVWKKDLEATFGNKKPEFGFCGSPLVVGGRVVIHPGGEGGPRLLALDADTGEKVWAAGTGSKSYSSPQLATLAGRQQVLVFNPEGVFGHDLSSGKELWHYEWKAEEPNPVSVQPTVLPGDRVFVGGSRAGLGSRCVQVSRKGESWSAEEAWQSKTTPAFNDVVLYEGYLYGLESGRLYCMDPASGELRWKSGGQYGSGQVLLLGGQLLIQAERGRLALVTLSPESAPKPTWHEALNDKTWNHPVVARGKLFVRNSKEMVCFAIGEGATAGR